MRSRVATAAAFLTATMLAGPAAAGPAPVPGDLWSRFPLEPSAEQTQPPGTARPVPRRVAPRQIAPRQISPGPADSSQARWILLGLGAAAAAAAAFALGRRRADEAADTRGFDETYPPGWVLKSDAADPTREEREPPAGRGVPVRTAATHNGVSLASAPPRTAPPRAAPPRAAPTRAAPPRAEPSLVEVLSPRRGLSERVEADAETQEPESQVCEILWWSGYLKGQFYVLTDRPLVTGQPLESPMFRARGSDGPERTEAAVAAHESLVAALAAAGWERDGRGAHWYSDRFRR